MSRPILTASSVYDAQFSVTTGTQEYMVLPTFRSMIHFQDTSVSTALLVTPTVYMQSDNFADMFVKITASATQLVAYFSTGMLLSVLV